MRRTSLALLAAVAATSFLTPAAEASIYCSDLGPVPGYGPVCTVKCVLGAAPGIVDPKDIKGTIGRLAIVCPA